MGCKFCASTKEGFERHLLASEIEGQILTIERYTKEKISNVVYMGIGEPLDNYDNVVRSIRLINDPLGLRNWSKTYKFIYMWASTKYI